MKLTNDNYFSPEANLIYMSTSQFKSFSSCQAKALAELKCEWKVDKNCFKEGHFFEACVTNKIESFIAENPDMISSRGETKGEIKSNYNKVINSANAFKSQKLFTDSIKKCEEQVILTGEIGGIKFKGCIDFLNPETLEGFDTKCMKDFNKIYSEEDKMRVSWYFAYGYNLQMAIYQELIRQNYGIVGNQHLLAVTKEEIPNVQAVKFSDEILQNAVDIIEHYAPIYDKIKRGEIEPERCEKCDYCKSTKVLTKFETVMEFE